MSAPMEIESKTEVAGAPSGPSSVDWSPGHVTKIQLAREEWVNLSGELVRMGYQGAPGGGGAGATVVEIPPLDAVMVERGLQSCVAEECHIHIMDPDAWTPARTARVFHAPGLIINCAALMRCTLIVNRTQFTEILQEYRHNVKSMCVLLCRVEARADGDIFQVHVFRDESQEDP